MKAIRGESLKPFALAPRSGERDRVRGPLTDERVAKIAAGDLVAAAGLMRALDDELPGAREALRALYPHGGQAFIVGVTGAPGVGKSTLVDALVAAGARAR